MASHLRLKRQVRNRLRRLERWWVRKRWSFDRADLAHALAEVGVERGDLLLVHSSFDRFAGFTGKPSDVVDVLQQAVGAEGTLLMPVIPFGGSALDFIERRKIFDIRRTPSMMGIVTELFRRSRGVRISVHPTHPVAAWGSLADELTASHHEARTPCGRHSPFHLMFEHDGKTLLLGVGIGAMTLYHSVEEELAGDMPFDPFTRESYSLECLSPAGERTVVTTRLFDREVSRRRDLTPLRGVLESRGQYRQASVGKLRIASLGARDVLAASQSLADQERFCYRGHGA